MLRAIGPFIVCLLLPMTIIACSKRDPVAKEASAATANLPVINDSVPDATGAPPAKAPATVAPQQAGRAIPTSLQGRWGLSPMDCTSTKGDAKGLLVVNADQIAFFESRAVPASDAMTGTDSISGNFSFTGEGQSWTKFEAFSLKGSELVRTESNPVASFTYARCK
jgi:hypothetical protein